LVPGTTAAAAPISRDTRVGVGIRTQCGPGGFLDGHTLAGSRFPYGFINNDPFHRKHCNSGSAIQTPRMIQNDSGALECRLVKLPRRGLPLSGLGALAVLLGVHVPPLATASTVVLEIGPSTYGQVSPEAVIVPPITQAHAVITGDTRPGGSPSRIAVEIPLPEIVSSADVVSAVFFARGFGGSAGPTLRWSIFGYAGTGVIGLDAGIDPDNGEPAGPQIAGPFTLNLSLQPPIGNLDVTDFIRSLVDAGATHAGFMFRDTNTPDNTRTGSQFIVVQDSPNWGGDIPPSLTLTLIPEPTTPLLAMLSGGLLMFRRRAASCNG